MVMLLLLLLMVVLVVFRICYNYSHVYVHGMYRELGLENSLLKISWDRVLSLELPWPKVGVAVHYS
jgi:hypothetical protein